jgi:hypothetical protein
MRVLLLVLCGLLVSGCFVFEEIDKGMEIMEAHTPAANKKKQEQDALAESGEKPPTYAEKVGGWFENAKSLAPGDSTSADPLIACRTGGRTLFTKRADCLARGGQPG